MIFDAPPIDWARRRLDGMKVLAILGKSLSGEFPIKGERMTRARRSAGPSFPLDRLERISITATEAQNEFGRILDSVVGDRIIVITRHNSPRAVLISIERFDALARKDETLLDTLTAEFDELYDRMQSPEANAAADRAFDASPEELGRAAATAARRRDA